MRPGPTGFLTKGERPIRTSHFLQLGEGRDSAPAPAAAIADETGEAA